MNTLTLPNKPKTKKSLKGFYLPDDIKSWLEEQSQQRNVSNSELVEYLLRQAINQTDHPLTSQVG